MTLHNTPINTAGMELSGEPKKPVDRKYEEANDQHIREIVLYPDASNRLFYDAAKTTAITLEEATRQFFNGVKILVATGVYATPASIDTTATVDSKAAVAFTVFTVESSTVTPSVYYAYDGE